MLVCLTAVLVTSAAAATTGISLDGKVYSFFGEVAGKTYTIEGKIFIFSEDSVFIQEEGENELVLAIEGTADCAAVKDAVVYSYSEPSQVIQTDDFSVALDTGWTASKAVECAVVSDYCDSFEKYTKYGLCYDAKDDILSYNGKRVRVFEDAYAADAEVSVSMTHFDPFGTIDVQAAHSQTDAALTGLTVLSDAEFEARGLAKGIQPREEEPAVCACSSQPLTEEEAKALYEPYESFGLTYEYQTNTLYFHGHLVRQFTDIKKSNGQPLESGYFSGSVTSFCNEYGTIDVTAIRDYTLTDAQGNGKLIGFNTIPVE